MTRDWRDDAACKDRFAEFDLIDGERPNKAEVRLGAATRVCLTACPVLEECKADFDPGLDGLCGVRFGQIIGLGKRIPVGGGQGHMKLKAIKHGTQGGAQAHRRRDEKVCPSCYQAELRARQDRDRKASA
jgi:hypothetical protein